MNQIRKALGISGIASSTTSFIAAPKDGFPGAQIDKHIVTLFIPSFLRSIIP
ncbi:MAG: hypothetical protein H6559_14000 [Lewinellaceae bacterium]|nr:hypothetical protein [Lewinellaceae bacterium]